MTREEFIKKLGEYGHNNDFIESILETFDEETVKYGGDSLSYEDVFNIVSSPSILSDDEIDDLLSRD